MLDSLTVQNIGDTIVCLCVFAMVLVVLGVVADFLADRDDA